MKIGDKVKDTTFKGADWIIDEIGDDHVLLSGDGITMTVDKDHFDLYFLVVEEIPQEQAEK